MVSVVFLRAANVGGHNVFKPSELVRRLAPHRIESIGAAGTFVVSVYRKTRCAIVPTRSSSGASA